MSTPASGWLTATTPETSPSGMSISRAPAARQAFTISLWRSRSSTHTVRSATSQPLARARFSRFLPGSLSRSTTPSGRPGPTAILSIPPLAVIVVPSSGSTAMSARGPPPVLA